MGICPNNCSYSRWVDTEKGTLMTKGGKCIMPNATCSCFKHFGGDDCSLRQCGPTSSDNYTCQWPSACEDGWCVKSPCSHLNNCSGHGTCNDEVAPARTPLASAPTAAAASATA